MPFALPRGGFTPSLRDDQGRRTCASHSERRRRTSDVAMPKQGGDGLGSALKKAQRRSRQRPANERHQDAAADVGLQSTVAQDDLDAMMDLAQLASRDFRASRGEVQVLLNGEKPTKDPKAQLEAELEHQEAVRVPRRPPWRREMSTEELDQVERASFLEWRRALAHVEQDKRVQLTPFEKNLQVWRQLWRVLERSHLVVQVIDARDPMRFLCEDLANYAKEVRLRPSRVNEDVYEGSMRACQMETNTTRLNFENNG